MLCQTWYIPIGLILTTLKNKQTKKKNLNLNMVAFRNIEKNYIEWKDVKVRFLVEYMNNATANGNTFHLLYLRVYKSFLKICHCWCLVS